MNGKMIYTNTNDVPGREIEEILGVITGSWCNRSTSGGTSWPVSKQSSGAK